MPSLVTRAEADSSDQELRELHEELLQQVCACQKCYVQLLSGAALVRCWQKSARPAIHHTNGTCTDSRAEEAPSEPDEAAQEGACSSNCKATQTQAMICFADRIHAQANIFASSTKADSLL